MFNLHRKLIGQAPMTYDAGMGAGAGASNFAGIYLQTRQDSRAERQAQFKEKQQNIILAEQQKQQAIEQSQGQNNLQDVVKQQSQELHQLKSQMAGDTVKRAVNYALANPDVQSTKDSIREIEANPLALKSLAANKGDLRVAVPDLDRDTIAKSYIGTGIDTDTAYKLADKSMASGMTVMYKNSKPLDLFSIGEAMGTTKTAPTPIIDDIEKNKHAIIKFAKGEDGTTQAPTDGTTQATTDGTTQAPATKPVQLETKEDGTKVGSTEITTEDGTKINAKVSEDKNGKSDIKLSNGSKATIQKDGTGVIKEANGNLTTISSDGSSVTVQPDGNVISHGYTLPNSVQMAYDLLGKTSSFSKNAELNRELAQARIDAIKNPKKSDWKDFLTQWKADPANSSRTLKDAREDWKAGTAGSESTLQKRKNFFLQQRRPDGSPRYTDAEASRMAVNSVVKGLPAETWQAQQDLEEAKKSGDPEKIKMAQRTLLKVTSTGGNVTRKDQQGDMAQSLATPPKEYKFDPSIPTTDYEAKQEALARSTVMNDSHSKARVDATLDTAKTVAQLKELSQDFLAAAKNGTFKSGPIDQFVNWASKKTGAELSTYTPKQIATQTGLDARTSMLVSSYIKALSGSQYTDQEFDNKMREVTGLASDQESVRVATMKSFQSEIDKNFQQDIRWLKDNKMYKTAKDRLQIANARTQHTTPSNGEQVKPQNEEKSAEQAILESL